jgi:hypothetical protein
MWNGITPRDAEGVKRLAAILREFPELVSAAHNTTQEDFTNGNIFRPYTPVTRRDGLFATEVTPS